MKSFDLANISAALTTAGHDHVFVQANTGNAKLMAAYKRLRELCTGTTAGAAVKKLWQSAVAAHAWYLDSVSNPDITSAKFEESCGDYTFNIIGFVEDLKEYETKAKAAGVGEEIIAAAHAFSTETKTAFATFRKSLKNEANAGVVSASEATLTPFAKWLNLQPGLYVGNVVLDGEKQEAVIQNHSTGCVAYFRCDGDNTTKRFCTLKDGKLELTEKATLGSIWESKKEAYAALTRLLKKLSASEATAAAEFTIKPSMKLEGDYGSIRMYEGSQLRTQSNISPFSSTKLVNIYKKAIEKTIKPNPHMFEGIDMRQRHSCHTTLTVSVYAPEPKPGVQISIMDLGKNDRTKRYEILLVNASGKPVYSKEDITPAMTLKITEMGEKVTASSVYDNDAAEKIVRHLNGIASDQAGKPNKAIRILVKSLRDAWYAVTNEYYWADGEQGPKQALQKFKSELQAFSLGLPDGVDHQTFMDVAESGHRAAHMLTETFVKVANFRKLHTSEAR